MIQIKADLKELLRQALTAAQETGDLPAINMPEIILEQPKQSGHGDLACNLPMQIAASCNMDSYNVARVLIKNLDNAGGVLNKIEVAGPGFINFFLDPLIWLKILPKIVKKGQNFGGGIWGVGKKAIVELVSANPTGPLHIGHGRCAAVGDVLARLLKFSGFTILNEYYINDAGNQMITLGYSLLKRIQELQGGTDFPLDNYYRGGYIIDLAAEFLAMTNKFNLSNLPIEEAASKISSWARAKIMTNIKEDLEKFGVEINSWYSESSLLEREIINKIFTLLRSYHLIYENEGALWFKAMSFGDRKDRVLRRSNGDLTYFASDIAYHEDKFRRDFSLAINVWGSDHHGYVPRLKAAMAGLGRDPDKIAVVLVQMVNLLRNGMPITMSTRAGEFVTLKEVINEVGTDSARFLLLSRRTEAQLDFDLEVAKAKQMENPVFYVQYAYARTKNVFKKANADSIFLSKLANIDLIGLSLIEEINLARKLFEFPEVVERAARNLEPHHITYYLHKLAGSFHSYYNTYRILTNDIKLTMARLLLTQAVSVVLANGLDLLGISAPENM